MAIPDQGSLRVAAAEAAEAASAAEAAEAASAAAGAKQHAVAIAYPMQGHINPMMHLCKRLASLGISITLVNTDGNHSKLLQSRERAGLPTLREQGFDIELVGISDGLPPNDPSHRGGLDDAIQVSLVAAEKMESPFEEFIEGYVKEGRPIACIISDAFLGWTQDVATKFGIPRVALWASSAAYNVLNYQLPLLSEKGYAPIRDKTWLEDENHIISFIQGVSPLHPRDLPSILQVESPVDPGFKKRAARTRRLKEAAWILVNTFDELEHDALHAMQQEIENYAAVGPLLPSAFLGVGGDVLDVGAGNGLWVEDDRCLQWLDRQSPSSVLYVSFGSLAPLSISQMQHLAEGIEASQQPFLWVIRPNMVSSMFDSFCNGFIERTKNRGIVIEWAPQLQVLFHPSVGGFLSHCGWNSTLESIAMGVPLLGLPCVAEQNLNCKHATVDWKVGTMLKRDAEGLVGSKEIERVVRRFMTGEDGMELRIRARELREAARGAVMQGGSSHKNLEAFVEAVKQSHLK